MDYLFDYDGHLHVHRLADGNKTARLLAHPSQAARIEGLIADKKKVEICSINQFPALELTDSVKPEEVLDQMGQVKAEPNAGGFRPISDFELTALKYAYHGEGMELSKAPEGFLRLIDNHPLVRGGVGFAYVHAALPVALLNLMMVIYDIRRFNDPENPGRYSRLRKFFRLSSPQAMLQLHKQLSSAGELDETGKRIQLVIQAWMGQEYAFSQPNDLDNIPSAFLFRHMYERRKSYMSSGVEQTRAHIMGCWRANLKFLGFIRSLWLCKVEGSKFEPQKFFNKECEVESFLQYIKKTDKLLDNYPPTK